WWSAFGVPPPPHGTLTVSLFCYPNIATAALFASWADDDAPVLCIVPEGVAPDALAQHFGAGTWRAGDVRQTGALTVVVAPFVDQPAFDRRLWSCALNIVRGEDSFVRAQWAR